MNQITDLILRPYNLTDQKIEKALSIACSNKIDFADIYFEYTKTESWMLEDGIIKSGNSSIDSGFGIRSVSGDKSGFAYSSQYDLKDLTKAAEMSRSIINHGQEKSVKLGESKKFKKLYDSASPLDSVNDNEKVDFLKSIDAYIKQKDSKIDQVILNLSGVHESILVMNSDGIKAIDERPLVRFSVAVILKDKERREQGFSGGGGRYMYDEIFKNKTGYKFADEALRQANINLNAIDCKAGTATVVLGPGWPGVLLHEAIGHGLEGDFNRKKTSAYTGLLGKKVASSECTVIDDGTIAKRRGSLSIDDEGCETQRTVLIENGILKGYMQDKLNSRLMKTSSTGNGRRESYGCLPMPRMTNTFMLPGKHNPNEIIESVKKGIYAANFSGGQVDITNGHFVFTASEAYNIRDGKIVDPVKDMTLIGNGPEILKKVSMVGNDLKLDEGVGTCGKDGQTVPVGVGQPTLKIDEITVGGTQL